MNKESRNHCKSQGTSIARLIFRVKRSGLACEQQTASSNPPGAFVKFTEFIFENLIFYPKLHIFD